MLVKYTDDALNAHLIKMHCQLVLRNKCLRNIHIFVDRLPRAQHMKQLLSIILLTFSSNVLAEWVEYSTRSNGDVYFFNNARVERGGDQVSVWTRVKYKTSVMAASSYQSLLRIDCSENSETVIQSTFFTDKNWNTPAMATNTHIKPAKTIKDNSATVQLVNILCKD